MTNQTVTERLCAIEAASRVSHHPTRPPCGGITHASASHETADGLAAIGWKLDDVGGLRINLTVPTGTVGVLELPGEAPREVANGSHEIHVDGIADDPTPTSTWAGSR